MMNGSKAGRFFVSLLVMFVLVFGDILNISGLLDPFFGTDEAEAAQSTIDAAVNTGAPTSYTHSGSQTVFTNDQTGYRFYRDSGGDCVYSKTTNGGELWGTPVQIDSQTDCIAIAVWYDQWTPNDTGTSIHIATLDSGSSDIWYNRLDTSSDTRLTGAAAITTDNGASQGGSFTTDTNYPAIAKATDGYVYVAVSDNTDSYVLRCNTSCGTTSNWAEAGAAFLDTGNPAANDSNILLPQVNGAMMIINRDVSANTIRSRLWNGTNWGTAWISIDAAAPENTTPYDVGMAAVVASSTSAATTTVFLTAIADNDTLGTNDDIRTYRYSNGVWAARTAVLTNNARGLTSVAIARDLNTESIYVAYSARTTAGTPATGNIYWTVSSSSMAQWETEKGPINTSASDMYGVDLNLSSDQRIYASWHDNTADDVYGDTIADLVPGFVVGTTTNQIATIRATSSNTYIGGAIALKEQKQTRSLTSITLTEKGTVNAQTGLANIRLRYENDIVFPFDCAGETYAGTEATFGSVDTDGFSGADGTSTFTGSASFGTSSALCLYPVVDVLNSAGNGETIDFEITSPAADISATLSPEIMPTTTVAILGATTIQNDGITQTHYHWRNDNGSETTATSALGSEDTAYTTYPVNGARRLRIGLSNEGSIATQGMRFRLEYAEKVTTCSAASGWTDVGAAGGDWDMQNSANLTDGTDTTDVAVASGGVTDENTVFLTPNGGVKDTSSQTGSISLGTTNYVALEYSVIASTSAAAGTSYCFRLTDQGNELDIYSRYPEATIAADARLAAFNAQPRTVDAGTTGVLMGGFAINANTAGTKTVTSITITASGTSLSAQNDITNIRLRSELDTVAPLDCAGETFAGTESTYGTLDTDGFSTASTSTFTGSVDVTTSQTMCVWVTMDIKSSTTNNALLDILIADPSNDIVRSSGTLSPSSAVNLASTTSIVKPVSTQTHYHWRRDNGTETTATSWSGGTEDTPIMELLAGTTTRLRIQVSNEGATSTAPQQYRLEYAEKFSSCAASSGWTDVGATGGHWDMAPSANLTEGGDTTNIAVATGGVTDENTTFLAANGGVRDTTSETGSLTLASTTFVELEYSITPTTASSTDNTTYCFRVTNAGTALDAYTVYPEAQMKVRNDFKIQRNSTTLTASTATITAGTDYEAPASASRAFIRITNTQLTGAGSNLATGNQAAEDVMVYISNPANILTSVTFERGAAAGNNTRVDWEIVEYIGPAGGDNEIIVRDQSFVTYGAAATTVDGASVTGVTNDNDIAVFITGQFTPSAGRADYNTGLSTSAWNSATDVPTFTRGEANALAATASYAVVEFTGANWAVQRVAHTYTAVGTPETESITAVNSLSRAFIHVQKTAGTGLDSHANFGHEVWLSSVGAVSFQLDSTATTPSDHTSVAWIIENQQTTGSTMVVTRSNNATPAGTAPLTVSVPIGKTLTDITNASIFTNNRGSGTGTSWPEPIMAVRIASTTHYELWLSNTGDTRNYRTEVVEWPTARRTLAQNYYRIYANTDAIDPTDPWPLGASNLGENTAMTGFDQPTSNGSVVRIRMSVKVSGQSSMPPSIDAFKLQYGKRTTSCTAITQWQDLGDTSSTTAQWRAYDNPSVSDGSALSTNPALAGALNLSVSDRAGTYEEGNDTPTTPYLAYGGEDVEFDWAVVNNNADARASYCFRMVEDDYTELTYNFYPTVRTVGFGLEQQNWRWYDDTENETPVTPLDGVAENVSPIDVDFDNTIMLRVTLREFNGAAGTDARLKLQFSESPTFASASDVVGSGQCGALSLWCYGTGGGTDSAVITTKTLSDADSCAGGVGRGCGTHISSSTSATTYDQPATSSAEYAFTIRQAGARANRTYYFRVYDVTTGEAVATADTKSYPSLSTAGAALSFAVGGVASSTVVEGVTTNVATTPTSIPFGSFSTGVTKNAAYQLTVDTNSTEGYSVFLYARSGLVSNQGDEIAPVAATNASPAAWATACTSGQDGCFGYHAGDDTLSGGSTRFAPNDSYAALDTTPREIAHSSVPANDTVTVIYRVTTKQGQAAGQYEADVAYIVVPIF